MDLLQAMYDSEINFEISTFWDGGFEWKLGDGMNGFVAEGNGRTMQGAADALAAAAIEKYPNSAFAKSRQSAA